MHAHSYLKSSIQILDAYKGEEPFSSFLKKYFGRNKKYGSRDRKQVSHLCYCYFRLGKVLPDISHEERILIGLFLCSDTSNDMLEVVRPEWNKKADSPLREKLLIINDSSLSDRHASVIEEVFPWKEEVSEGIDHEKFCESFFVQPDLFIRLRPGYESMVKTKLLNHGVSFSEITSTCLSLPNASRIENVIELDKEAVVQDLNSQQTGNFLRDFEPGPLNLKLSVWDCCAASGGKSLMLYDLDPDIQLTVSDVRASILANLKKRFAKAGVKNYKAFIADLTQRDLRSETKAFDLVICDAPCTGSGTWSRTPEQLYFFNEKKIGHYSLLQKKIVLNVIPRLKRNGFLLYITCSVFNQENEEVVEFAQRSSGIELIKMELLKGYDKKADSMFVALLKKIS
jgi:16S rRNA (cytosine967-C5)-methyltransferase